MENLSISTVMTMGSSRVGSVVVKLSYVKVIDDILGRLLVVTGVEQGALISLNPSGKLEDPTDVCVCCLFV